ncbi:MAG: carboxypeptidase regulatory-like domain-containing protein [Cyanobacteria bacterium NC_groundwater_1444_Ag_S-0.65um_54_12]|nr:carboxypeptidase regulatory-like domain-containing protein [Cyanobacteria bacterium NC_groundwater_1444_Ag_S-0.65um_54_12]
MVFASFANMPAMADSLWGYSGLALVPSGEVLKPGDYSTGAHLTFFSTDTMFPLYLSAGVLDGLEVGLTYPGRLGGATNIAGNLSWQLVRATRENPTRVAVGITNIGMPLVTLGPEIGDSFVSPNNLFMVLSRDFSAPVAGAWRTLATGYLGFTGAAIEPPFLNLASRVMLGLDIPFRDYGSLYGEYLGPSVRSGQFFNLGLRYQPLASLDLNIASLGQPGQSYLDRAYVVGVTWHGHWVPLLKASEQLAAQLAVILPASNSSSPGTTVVENVNSSTRPHPGTKPDAPVNSTAAAATKLPPPPQTTPPSAPSGTVYGRVLSSEGLPLANVQVGLVELTRWSNVTALGAYFLAFVPKGNYTLAVQGTQGKLLASRSIEVPGDGPFQADLQVAVSPAAERF